MTLSKGMCTNQLMQALLLSNHWTLRSYTSNTAPLGQQRNVCPIFLVLSELQRKIRLLPCNIGRCDGATALYIAALNNSMYDYGCTDFDSVYLSVAPEFFDVIASNMARSPGADNELPNDRRVAKIAGPIKTAVPASNRQSALDPADYRNQRRTRASPASRTSPLPRGLPGIRFCRC